MTVAKLRTGPACETAVVAGFCYQILLDLLVGYKFLRRWDMIMTAPLPTYLPANKMLLGG